MPLASTTEAVELRLRPTARIFFPPISTSPASKLPIPGSKLNTIPPLNKIRWSGSRSARSAGRVSPCPSQPRPYRRAIELRRRPPAPPQPRSDLAAKALPNYGSSAFSGCGQVIDHCRLLPYPSYLDCKTCETIAGWLSPQLRRGGTPYDLAESSMLLYVKEVLPMLKSCIWVCDGTRDGLSAGGSGIRTAGPPPVKGLAYIEAKLIDLRPLLLREDQATPS